MGGLTRHERIVLLAFFALLCFPVLYICRFLDNNTLTSWQWVFAGVSVPALMGLTLAAIAVSCAVSRKIPFERHPRTTFVALGLAAVVPLWSEPELLIDSGRYFLQAKYLAEYGLPRFAVAWGGELAVWTDLPLVPALYGLLFKFFGEARVVVQLFNTLLFGLTILLTAGTGRLLWNRETGFYAGLLLLGMPYLLTQVGLMLVDIAAMFFLTLALYLFIRALREGGKWLFLAVAAILSAMSAKYSIWPMLLVLPLAAVVLKSDNRRLLLARAGAVFLAAVLLGGLLIWMKLPLFRDQLELLLNFQRPALGLWQEDFLSTFFFQTHPFISLLALWGCFRAWRTGDRHFLIAAFFALMVFGLQMKRLRYILPLLPLFAMMASCGLQTLKDRVVRRFAGLTIVFSALIILLAGYLPFFKTTSMVNIQEAARFLDTLPGEEIEVYVLPQQNSGGNTALAIPQLDLFTTAKISSRQKWQDLAETDPAELAPLLFSWHMARPSYYAPADRQDGKPLVVISDGNDGLRLRQELPTAKMINRAFSPRPGISQASLPAGPSGSRLLVRRFDRQSGVFRFNTTIEIYR